MFWKQHPLFFWVETPLHAGSGNDLGIVDLPIQREKHTGFPKIEASGIKGCLRESFEDKLGVRLMDKNGHKELNLAFGPENTDNAHAGALGFSDARLLLFPVKSAKGVFAWITCPQVINRFKRDLELCGISNAIEIPPKGTVPAGCDLFVKDKRIVLEEYTFVADLDEPAGPTTNLAEWLKKQVAKNMGEFWKNKIGKDILVLSDEDFKDFVTMSTEVIARTKIDDITGTVARGALWYEEYLPTDSVLYSIVFAGPVFKEKDEDKGEFQVKPDELKHGSKPTELEAQKVMAFFQENLSSVIQIGGNATIGKGFVRTVFLGTESKEAAKCQMKQS